MKDKKIPMENQTSELQNEVEEISQRPLKTYKSMEIIREKINHLKNKYRGPKSKCLATRLKDRTRIEGSETI